MTTEMRNQAQQRLAHGRLVVTAKSKVTGEHITLRFQCKNKNLPRQKITLADALIIAVDAGRVQMRTVIGRGGETHEYKTGDRVGWLHANNYMGLLAGALENQTVKANYNADTARVWAANKILSWLGGEDPHRDLEINLEDFCAACGRQLTHPESKERGLGPVCYGRATVGQHQQRSPRPNPDQLNLIA